MYFWFLENAFEKGGQVNQRRLSYFPQVIGREAQLDCSIICPSISLRHARIEQQNNQIFITDLNSENGTFVNRKKIDNTTQVRHGDIIQLGKTWLRLVYNREKGYSSDDDRSSPDAPNNGASTPGATHLEDLIDKKQVSLRIHPVYRASDLGIVAYRISLLGTSNRIPEHPNALFRLAETYKLEITLAEFVRNLSIQMARKASLQKQLLVQSHPRELRNLDRLLSSLCSIRKDYPKQPIMLEAHHFALRNDIRAQEALQRELQNMNISLAFDTYSLEHIGLSALEKAPPDLITFSKDAVSSLVPDRQNLNNTYAQLKNLADKLHINTLAEGLENKSDFELCKHLDFSFYQGSHLDRALAP